MANRALVLPALGKKLVLENRHVPVPGEGEIVVENYATALNPANWKIQEQGHGVKQWPLIMGNDMAGVVEAVGSGVTRFKVGDRVLGSVHSPFIPDDETGSFQEHVKVMSTWATHLPEHVSFAGAATLPMGSTTAAGALKALDVQLPHVPKSTDNPTKAILIWGGASSVGTSAIQFAHAAGLFVATTASPQHHQYLRDIGADLVFDYRSSTVAEDLKSQLSTRGLTISKAFDSVAADPVTTAKVFSAIGGGDLAMVLSWKEEAGVQEDPPANVKPFRAGVVNILNPPDYAPALLNDLLERMLKDGSMRPAKVEIVPGGLGGIQAGLEKLKQGVSGVKLVAELK